MVRLYAAGYNAVALIGDGAVEIALEGRGARCLAVDPKDSDTLYVGTSDEGLFRSTDGGGSWDHLSGIEHPRVTAAAVSPADGAVYAGTEPSALFVSRDGGASWREFEGMRKLPSAPTWSFPPRPWISHVRAVVSMIFRPTNYDFARFPQPSRRSYSQAKKRVGKHYHAQAKPDEVEIGD